MELRIDNMPCDLGTERLRIPPFDMERMCNPSTCREGRTMKVLLPPTAVNSRILCRAEDTHAATSFNSELHRATVLSEGVVLFRGTVRLVEISDEGYRVEIRSGGAAWAEMAARRRMADLDIEWQRVLNPTTVCESWSDTSPVKFFPLLRDSYPAVNNSMDLLPSCRLLSTDDYHPFLHVATMLEEIFAQAGYGVESEFLGSEFFRKLYISGALTSRDSSAAEARMGFMAGRRDDTTATANHAGRVYADPTAIYNTLGNIVEVAAADAVDGAGNPIRGLYNNGGCFSTDDDNRICFTPAGPVSASFDYRLCYTTDHRIRSRHELTAFDTFYLGEGTHTRFTLQNRYEDRRGNLQANHSYRALVFDHTEGRRYRLIATIDGIPDSTWVEFDTRSTLVATPQASVPATVQLLCDDGDGWRICSEDWALYDGHIGECGTTTVEVRLRTAPVDLVSGRPHHFDEIFIEGAEPGMSITLHKGSTLTPRFHSAPGIGSRLEFGDVARHTFRQIDFVEALAQMFNLRFYTSEELHKVWIEPADNMADTAPAADWTKMADLSQPVVRTPLAPLHHEIRTLRYQAGDGVVTRLEAAEGERFGQWSRQGTGYASKQGEDVATVPLFAPTLSSADALAEAPSAVVMQVGDRDSLISGDEVTPRIVLFEGMHPLPAGERWDAPSDGGEYPLAAFHFAGDDHTAPFTLSFSDRDTACGLHSYHERQLERENVGERIELTLRMPPDRYAALFAPGCGLAELRSRITLDPGQGRIGAAIVRLGAYDPATASLRCTLERTR